MTMPDMRRFALALMTASMLSACTAARSPTPAPTTALTSPSTPTLTPPSPTASPRPTPPPATAKPAAQFPRTITDDEGTELTLAAEPERIVSLTPANTELVYSLGAGDLLMGGTDFDDYPPEAAALPDVVQSGMVLTEQIVNLRPDLVLAGGNSFTPAADVQRLRDLHIPVIVVYPQTVEQVKGDLTLVGTALGRDHAAADIVAAITSRVDDVTAAVAGSSRPRVFYELGIVPDIYGPAPDSFVEDMINFAGGEAITTTDPAVFSIPLERLVTEDPEVIVLGDAAYGTCPDSVHSRPGWEDMTAVKNGDIRPVDDIIVTRPGPRLGEGLAALALAIHPDADIEPPAAGSPLCTE